VDKIKRHKDLKKEMEIKRKKFEHELTEEMVRKLIKKEEYPMKHLLVESTLEQISSLREKLPSGEVLIEKF